MNDRAHVRSIDTLTAFRAGLVTCAAEARVAVEGVMDEVSRTREWLHSNRLPYWQGEVRRRRQALEDARSALRSARVTTLRTSTDWHAGQVTRALRALEDAEVRLRSAKRWCREYDDHTAPRVKPLHAFSAWMAHDMALALAELQAIVASLDAYTTERPPPLPDAGTEQGAGAPQESDE